MPLPNPGLRPLWGLLPGATLKVRRQSGLAATHAPLAATIVAGRMLRGASLQVTQATNYQPIASLVGLPPRSSRTATMPSPQILPLFHFSLAKILANYDKSLILPMLTALQRPGPRVICGWGSENLHMKSVYLALSS